MPELPEVRAHAERLTAGFAGAVLERFEPLSFTVLRTYDPPPDAAVGSPLVEVDQRGKLLVLRFEPLAFVVHLMQGGRLRPDAKRSAKPRGGQARWRFADHDALLLTEPGSERKAGVWTVVGDPLDAEPLGGLGPDADTLDADELAARLADPPARLHTALRDQHRVAGIGRRLANEICHRARLSPFASTATLDADRRARLQVAVLATIDESLAFEREQSEMVPSAARPGAVHGRAGEPCPVCGDTVRAVEYRAYTVAYCPTCQTGGKVLAD
ncbi:MAG TPA: DNA-formamidopyrimidine glycosylase family protein, partial [Acidimicrobiales bacterium]|nr:DNA-formamidopyrimidine glycosylase family protein [Acidimicrobiales bacterium]